MEFFRWDELLSPSQSSSDGNLIPSDRWLQSRSLLRSPLKTVCWGFGSPLMWHAPPRREEQIYRLNQNSRPSSNLRRIIKESNHGRTFFKLREIQPRGKTSHNRHENTILPPAPLTGFATAGHSIGTKQILNPCFKTPLHDRFGG